MEQIAIERLEKRLQRIRKTQRLMESTSRFGLGYANPVSSWILSKLEKAYWHTVYEEQALYRGVKNGAD